MRWLLRRHYQAGEWWHEIATRAVNNVRMQLLRAHLATMRERVRGEVNRWLWSEER